MLISDYRHRNLASHNMYLGHALRQPARVDDCNSCLLHTIFPGVLISCILRRKEPIMRVFKGVLFLACIGLLLTACGGQNSQTTKSDTVKSTTITVNVHDNYFDPQNVAATPG